MSSTTSFEVPRASFQAWAICLIASLFCFYEFVQLMMFNAIDASLMQAFNIDATHLGTISASYLFANIIFMFPAGIILDRMSTRRLIVIAMCLCVCGTVLFSFSNTMHMAMLGRFLTGIGGAFPFLACLRLASRWMPARKMGLVTGLMITIMMLGGIAGQTPMTYLVKIFGWREALRIDALMGIGFIILICSVVRDYPPNYPSHMREHGFNPKQVKQSVLSAITNKENWLYGLYTCLLNLPVMLLGAVWGGLFLTQVHGFTALQASYITSMIFFGTIVGSPVLGWVSDRLGLRKWPMIIGAVLAVFSVLLIMYLTQISLSGMLLLFFLLGFITSTQIISYPAIAETNPHHQAGAALGLASVIIMAGAAFFQPLFGWLMDLTWSGATLQGVAQYSLSNYHAGFMIFPITFIIGLIAVLFAKETRLKTDINKE